MNSDILLIINNMFTKLSNDTTCETVSDGWIEISFPFLNRINDGICIYAKIDGDKILFSDDGEAIDLFLLGGKSIDDAEIYARTHGVKIVGNELRLEAKMDDAVDAMAQFLACVISIGNA